MGKLSSLSPFAIPLLDYTNPATLYLVFIGRLVFVPPTESKILSHPLSLIEYVFLDLGLDKHIDIVAAHQRKEYYS